MDEHARQAYLQTQVMNASPQKLQWLLLDGALRFSTQAETAWESSENERASESLDRARQIVVELLSGLRPKTDEIAARVMPLYLWLFRSLAEAQLQHNSVKLAEVIRILKIERDTWQQVCEQMQDQASEQAAESHSPPAPIAHEASLMTESSGFSFEA